MADRRGLHKGEQTVSKATQKAIADREKARADAAKKAAKEAAKKAAKDE